MLQTCQPGEYNLLIYPTDHVKGAHMCYCVQRELIVVRILRIRRYSTVFVIFSVKINICVRQFKISYVKLWRYITFYNQTLKESPTDKFGAQFITRNRIDGSKQ